MNQNRLVRLLQEYFDGTISKTDAVELLAHLNEAGIDRVTDVIDEKMLSLDNGPEFNRLKKQEVLRRIKSDPRFLNDPSAQPVAKSKIIKLYQRKWLSIAAALLVFGIGISLYVINSKTRHIAASELAKKRLNTPIVPGSNKATLTLSNGQVVVLDTADNGLIASNGASRVFKNGKGQLVYHPTAEDSLNTKNNIITYNTLSTPKGGMFQVVLPDGSKVWLNSASSLKFPTEFSGNERRVTLTGEAYFEAAKNKEKPFFVDINHTEIRVLGTHFNIDGYYDDNDITTTLLEGSVQVKNDSKLSIIKPGEQALCNKYNGGLKVKPANIEQVMAWKNGYFIFGDEDITSIMKKISRWYDVDVEYRGDFSNIRLGGTFYRSKSINELLSYMQEVGKIHFETIGRRIVIMK